MNHQDILEKLVEETLLRDFQLQERQEEMKWEDSQIQALSEMTQFNEIEIKKILLETKKTILEKKKKQQSNIWFSVATFLLIIGIFYFFIGLFGLGGLHGLYAIIILILAGSVYALTRYFQREIIIDKFDGTGYRWSQTEDRKVKSWQSLEGYYFQSFGKCYSDKYTPDIPTSFIAELKCRWQAGEYEEYGLLISFGEKLNLRFILTGKGNASACIYDRKKKDFIDNFSWKRNIVNTGKTDYLHTLKVQKIEDKVSFWVNQDLIEEFTFDQGKPDYFSIRSCGDQTVLFKDLKITDLEKNELFYEDFSLGNNNLPINARDSFNYLKKMTSEGYVIETNREDHNYWTKRDLKLSKSWDIQLEMTHIEGENEFFGLVLEFNEDKKTTERLYCYIKKDGSGKLATDISNTNSLINEKFRFETNTKKSYRLTFGYNSDIYKTKGIFLAINHDIIFKDLDAKLPKFNSFGVLVSGYQKVRFNNLMIDRRK